MKKFFFPPLFLLALAIAAAPYFVGMKIQSEVSAIVDQVNSNTAYELEWINYDRGWLTSEAQIRVGMKFPSASDDADLAEFAELFSLNLDIDIEHGPFLKSNGLGQLSWNHRLSDAEGLRQYIDWDQAKPLYEFTAVMGLNGDINFDEYISTISSAEGAMVGFTFGGYLGAGDVVAGQMSYSGKSGSTEIDSPFIQASIGPLDMHMNMEAAIDKIFNGELYDADVSLSVPNLNVSGIQTMDMTRLKAVSQIRIEPGTDLGTISVGYSIGSISTGAFSATEAAFDISIENYSSEFNRRYTEFATNLAYGDNPDPDPEVINEFLRNTLPILLEAAPVFKLDRLAFSLPDGDFNSNAEVRLDAISSLPAGPSNPIFWADKVAAKANISADQGVIDYIGYLVMAPKVMAASTEEVTAEEIQAAVDMQLDMGIGMLSGMGVLVPTDTGYNVELEYDHGTTLVNGQDFGFPLGSLLGQ